MDFAFRLGEYEEGRLGEDQIVELFQELLDSGVLWHLQGHYGRTAMSLLEQGLIVPKRAN